MSDSLEPREDRPSSQPSERPAPGLRRSTLIVTNLAKVVSLLIAFNEMVIRHQAREAVIAYCALSLIGAQAFEEIVIHAIDRIFGRS
jgi:hypothetical protein